MTEQRSPQFEPKPGDVLRNMYGDLVKVVDVDCFGEVTFECPPGTEPRYCLGAQLGSRASASRLPDDVSPASLIGCALVGVATFLVLFAW